jgi:hypothetical protein
MGAYFKRALALPLKALGGCGGWEGRYGCFRFAPMAVIAGRRHHAGQRTFSQLSGAMPFALHLFFIHPLLRWCNAKGIAPYGLLKDNRPATLAAVENLFDPLVETPNITPYQTVEQSHGRHEQRCYSTCTNPDDLFSRRGTRNNPIFPGVAMVGQVQK